MCTSSARGLGAPGVWLVAALAMLGASCQQSDTHAPLTGDCTGDPRCNPHPGNVGIGFPVDGGSQNPPVDAGPQGTLSGNVLVLEDLAHSQLYPLPATVTADGSAMALTSGSWDGVNPFVLPAVKLETENWVSVQPSTQGADEQLTLTPVPTISKTVQDVFVVRGTTLDAVFDVLTAKPFRNAALAQIVVQFLDATTGTPISGLTVAMPGAADVAYANSNSWTDVPGATTDNTGTVVFANVAATGAPAGITIGGARVGTASVRAVAGGISVAAFSLAQ